MTDEDELTPLELAKKKVDYIKRLLEPQNFDLLPENVRNQIIVNLTQTELLLRRIGSSKDRKPINLDLEGSEK